MRKTMTLAVAARWLGVSRRDLRAALKRGDLKGVKLTDSPKAQWRISTAELSSWWRSRGGGELTAGGLDDDDAIEDARA